MRGTILGFDSGSNEGIITDQEGRRIKFARHEWKSTGEPLPGRAVDFDLVDDQATAIFIVPGSGSPLNLDGQDPAKQSMIFGIISLVCGILTFFLGVIGIVTVVLAIIFGIKGKNIGAELPDKTGYYLSIAGLILSGIALFITLLAMTACAGLVGLAGSMGAFH